MSAFSGVVNVDVLSDSRYGPDAGPGSDARLADRSGSTHGRTGGRTRRWSGLSYTGPPLIYDGLAEPASLPSIEARNGLCLKTD
jgi:hypothetical protein